MLWSSSQLSTKSTKHASRHGHFKKCSSWEPLFIYILGTADCTLEGLSPDCTGPRFKADIITPGSVIFHYAHQPTAMNMLMWMWCGAICWERKICFIFVSTCPSICWDCLWESLIVHVCVCGWHWGPMSQCRYRGQRTTLWSWFSPCSFLDSAAQTNSCSQTPSATACAHWAISSALMLSLTSMVWAKSCSYGP